MNKIYNVMHSLEWVFISASTLLAGWFGWKYIYSQHSTPAGLDLSTPSFSYDLVMVIIFCFSVYCLTSGIYGYILIHLDDDGEPSIDYHQAIIDAAYKKPFRKTAPRQKVFRQDAIIQAGKEGEERVKRFLQQLAFPNTVINDKYVDNIDSVKDAQIDHFVVSEKGIVMIETKNYSGEIDMTDKNQWIQVKSNGERKACTNAYYQSVTHMQIMQNLMKQDGFDDVRLYAIVVFANDKTIYHGLENYHGYVMKYDAMNYFITGLPRCKAMTKQRQEEVIEWIRSFKDANSYEQVSA